MAKTELHNYSVQEKLNKMDADVIEVDVSAVTSHAGDLMYVPTEIPNAVAVPGGTCLIQSILSHNPTDEDQSHNLFISNSDNVIEEADGTDKAADDALGSVDIHADSISGIQGIVPIPGGYSIGDDDTVASVLSIGIVAKAAAGSTSLWVWGIATTGDAITQTLKLKFGIIKD